MNTIVSNKELRICFVAHNAYGALARVDTGHTGGIERQQSLMAKWLGRNGHSVSMVTWDEGQTDGVEIEGVRVYKMCCKDAGLPGLRFLWPRWASLRQAMKRADADIYYYNIGDLGLGQVVMWCRSHGRKCIYSVASDPDCDRNLPALRPLRERVLYRYGLRHVDHVVAQTHHQQDMLSESFGIESTVIPMPCGWTGAEGDGVSVSGPDGPFHVLWIGRIREEKRLEWLLDVAELCPELEFDVVGAANTQTEYASALCRRASHIPNVTMHGRVVHDEMMKFYRSSRILCCTSTFEGFPNTFLEAWSLGVPVVSTFAPDDLIAARGLGWMASSVEELSGGLKHATESPHEWLTASQAAQAYYSENHTLDACMAQFEQVFQDVLGGKSLENEEVQP